MLNRHFIVAKLLVQTRQLDAGFGRLLGTRRPAPHQCERALLSIGVNQQARQSTVAGRVVGIEIKALVIETFGLLQQRLVSIGFAQRVISSRQVVVGVGVVWIQCQ